VTTTEITGRTASRKLVRFVGHYLEMVAAMVIGMVALAPLWPTDWLGALPGTALVTVGHVIMFPLMLAAMLWRRSDYWQ
jgi:hypothetical protein